MLRTEWGRISGWWQGACPFTTRESTGDQAGKGRLCFLYSYLHDARGDLRVAVGPRVVLVRNQLVDRAVFDVEIVHHFPKFYVILSAASSRQERYPRGGNHSDKNRRCRCRGRASWQLVHGNDRSE